MTEKEMWSAFAAQNPDAKKYSAWQFGGNTPEMPDILAKLVLDGIKTATAGAYTAYIAENEPLPEVGAYSLVLDTRGDAVCIIKTTKAYTAPFIEVSAEHAYKEGEFDRSLEKWRECHEQVFTMELAELGQEFTADMLVVCEEFEMVYPK